MHNTLQFTARHWKIIGPLAVGATITVGVIFEALPGDTLESAPTPMPTPALSGSGGGGELQRTAVPTQRKTVWVCEPVGRGGSSWMALEKLGMEMGKNPYGENNGSVELRHPKGPPETYDWFRAMRENELVFADDEYCAED